MDDYCQSKENKSIIHKPDSSLNEDHLCYVELVLQGIRYYLGIRQNRSDKALDRSHDRTVLLTLDTLYYVVRCESVAIKNQI